MPMTMIRSPRQNRILAALPGDEYARLADDLEMVSLTVGQVLYESGDTLGFVYFPATCIVSLIFATESGWSTELAMTGNDGLIGIPLVLGGETTTHRVVVQSEGVAYRLRTEVLCWELDQGGVLQRLCLCYAQALMTQMAQSVVCNRHHAVDQQLCRWLLLSLDLLPGNQLNMTQEMIASMLGVRREAVTEAAGKLQAAGLIQYSRGHITVIDRPGLEARACECYGVVKSEYDRLFQLIPDALPHNRARPNPATLRQRAEARLKQSQPTIPSTAWDAERLLHELQVHQIELEMHNEELRHAYDEADTLRDKYADIYDFAPVGYFTIDALGVIVQLNLAGAILLGIKRSQSGRYRFAASIKPEFLPEFKRFHEEVLGEKIRKFCEVGLLATDKRPEAIVRIEAVPNESHSECRMVVMDITAEKQARQALQEREHYQRALLDNFPFMVWLKDGHGHYLAVNEPFARHCGWPSVEAAVGKTDFDITSREMAEAARADDLAVLNSGEKKNGEEIVEEDGERRWFETYKSPVDMNGQRIGTVGFSRDISQRKQMQEKLQKLATTDLLTELATRQHFIDHLERARAAIQRDANYQAVVLLLDLDDFQSINAKLGHGIGDAMLRLVSALVREEVRKVDIAGRMDGDQFSVLMPNSDLDDAAAFAERLRKKVSVTAVNIGERRGIMTASIGIASINAEDSTAEQVLARANEALELAKASGRDMVKLAAGSPASGTAPGSVHPGKKYDVPKSAQTRDRRM